MTKSALGKTVFNSSNMFPGLGQLRETNPLGIRRRESPKGTRSVDKSVLHMQHKTVSPSPADFSTLMAMNPKTEEFLNLLLWSADLLARPTFRNLTDSYESWAYRNGLLKQVSRLEHQQLIERDASSPDDRLYRLSAQGRLHVLGGRDPEERWARAWDGQWRLVIFDVPTGRNAQRERLRRYLRDKGFGYLQNSVWIRPDSLEAERQILGGGRIDVESLILLEARPCAGESDAEIVAGAWDFERINRRYARHLKVLEARTGGVLRSDAAAKALLSWAAAEREAWLDAVTNDPLLPAKILPSNYLGQQAWRRRVEVLRDAGRQLRTLNGR
jgi:phenylacetic acid degradation operon negative regulatory protein